MKSARNKAALTIALRSSFFLLLRQVLEETEEAKGRHRHTARLQGGTGAVSTKHDVIFYRDVSPPRYRCGSIIVENGYVPPFQRRNTKTVR